MPSALTMSNAFMTAHHHARSRAKRDSSYPSLAERWEQKAARHEIQAVLIYDLAYSDIDALPEFDREAKAA